MERFLVLGRLLVHPPPFGSAVALLLALAGCAGAAPAHRPQVLRISSVEDVHGLNPHLDPQFVTGLLSELTMAYLVRTDARGLPRPELAREVPTRKNGGISADGRTIVYHLRHDARWSDGAPFTAKDVVFTAEVVRDPSTSEVRGYPFDRIASVRALDPYTVEVRLRVPFAPLVELLFSTASGACILPQHLLAGRGSLERAAYNELPVGIGPFTYTRWVHGEAVELAANPRYFRGRPKLDRIVYKIVPDRNTLFAQLRTGELDLWIFPSRAYLDRLEHAAGIRVIETRGFGVVLEVLNARRGPLANADVRRALLLADDREAVLRSFAHGRGSVGDAVFPPGHPLHVPIGATPYDPAAARALLERAGWRPGRDGIRLNGGHRLALRLVTVTGSPDTDRRIELLRASFRDVGVELLTRRYPASLVFGPASAGGLLASGEFDLAPVGELLGPDGDLESRFSCSMAPPRGVNYGGYCDPELDRAMASLAQTYDPRARLRAAEAVERRIAAGVPAIVDNYPTQGFALSTAVRNFRPNPLAPLDDVMELERESVTSTAP